MPSSSSSLLSALKKSCHTSLRKQERAYSTHTPSMPQFRWNNSHFLGLLVQWAPSYTTGVSSFTIAKKVDYVFAVVDELHVQVSVAVYNTNLTTVSYPSHLLRFEGFSLVLIIQAVRKMYCHFNEENPMQEIVFECAEIELDLPFSSPVTVDGWKITPLKHPKVLVYMFLVGN